MAFVDTVADLFDKSTWKNIDYDPLVDLVQR
jgi:hypothetical protein